MRNLKKILALVLALVMSLSLMAVASADDELNLGDVSDVYAESVDVLTGLKVFMGNKGEFLPKDNITRAEVAAIIYRIVTGDVTNSQNGIYADYNKFSDVTSDAWYAGYVNYCANAEYVKGVGYDANGKAMFKPQQNVTGYEALAMILRAIGYDRNNEFTGPSWQIQTAATARNRGILKNIAEGTLGGAATREAVAEILCQTILVPKADYSLAFGYRIEDANGNPNPTLAYETFKMEKISGVVVANEQASLEDTKPLAATQTKLNLTDGTSYTLNVASTLDDIGESRYVYVIPQTGSTRFDLVCSKVYDTGKNNVYDSGDKVATVGDSTGKDNGITSIAGAQHFVNYDQTDEYTTKIRIEYVLRGRWSDYQARSMFVNNKTSGSESWLYTLSTDANGAEVKTEITNSVGESKDWSNVITSAGYSAAGHTYEYRKVINAFTKLTTIDWDNIRTIFSTGDLNGTNIIVGEIYVGTNTTTSTADGKKPVDISDGKYKWETFVADYLEGANNKKQVTTNELGNRLKIVDNNNDGVAEYVLKTIYTVGIITANNGIDIANLNLTDGDAVNEVTATTPVVNDGEGELAAGNVVIYAKIDGNARAQLAATETAKINTVNRADLTATAEDGTTWKESWVHTHSTYLHSHVSGIYPNTTYTLYFDNYGNLAAYTEGENGGFVLITDGWYRSALNGGEYAVQAYIDGALKTVELTNGGSLFVNSNGSVNDWNRLKRDFGSYTINNEGKTTESGQVHTIVGTLEGGILTPVDKTYRWSKNMVMLDMIANAVPGRDGARANVYTTNYVSNGTAYNNRVTAEDSVTVNALSNTTYYYVFKQNNTTAVRTYTGYASIPAINNMYIEDVYAVGSRALDSRGTPYYTADVVVVELNSRYNGAMFNAEQVFIPSFPEVSGMISIDNVMMIRGNGSYENVKVNMAKSDVKYYDIADTSANVRSAAGLYTMTLDEGSTDTYVIKRMTPAQIRANNYMTGFISKSYNTLTNDYAVVEMWAQDDDQTVVNPVAPAAVNELPGGNQIQSRRVTENSKTYTLGYDSLYNATLKEDTAANVLTQAGDSIIRDVEKSGLNERWVVGTDTFTNPSLNEVLVRYDNSGNVIWAVSFREYRGTARDYAQTVWYKNLISETPSASEVLFWNNPAAANATTRISHAAALLGRDTYGASIVDFGNLLNSATSWSLTSSNIPVSITNMTDLAAYNTITNAEETYTLTIVRSNGTTEVYTLIKEAAKETASLSPLNKYGDKSSTITGDQFDSINKGLTLEEFLDDFAIPAGATADWTFVTNGTRTIQVSGKNNTNAPAAPKYDVKADQRENMTEIKYVIVTVTSEKGDAEQTYRGGAVPTAAMTVTGLTSPASGPVYAGQALPLTAPSAGTITITVNGKVDETKTLTESPYTYNYTVPSDATTLNITFEPDTTTPSPDGKLTLGNVTTTGVTVTADAAGSIKPGAGADLGNTDGATTVYVEFGTTAVAGTYILQLTNAATGKTINAAETITLSSAEAGTKTMKSASVQIPAGDWTLNVVKKGDAQALTVKTVHGVDHDERPFPEVAIKVDGYNVSVGSTVSIDAFASKTVTVEAPAGYVVGVTANGSGFTVEQVSGKNEWTVTNNNAAAAGELQITVNASTGYQLVRIDANTDANSIFYKDTTKTSVMTPGNVYALETNKAVVVSAKDGYRVGTVGVYRNGSYAYNAANGAVTDRVTGDVSLTIRNTDGVLIASAGEARWYASPQNTTHGMNIHIGWGYYSSDNNNVHWLTEDEMKAELDNFTFTISESSTAKTLTLTEVLDFDRANNYPLNHEFNGGSLVKLHTCTNPQGGYDGVCTGKEDGMKDKTLTLTIVRSDSKSVYKWMASSVNMNTDTWDPT